MTKQGDLISRDALKKAIHSSNLSLNREWLLMDLDKIIDNAPTVKSEKAKESEIIKAYTKGFDTGVETVKNERPQGEWIHLLAIGDYKCSICGAENLYKYANEHERWIKTNSNFCPNCGAKMEGGAE